MYADNITKSMDKSIKETERRRVIQMEYNEEHNITPTTVIKGVRDIIEATKVLEEKENYESEVKKAAKKDIPVEKLIEQYEEEMKEAAKNLQFERAAELRDIIKDLKENSK